MKEATIIPHRGGETVRDMRDRLHEVERCRFLHHDGGMLYVLSHSYDEVKAIVDGTLCAICHSVYHYLATGWLQKMACSHLQMNMYI